MARPSGRAHIPVTDFGKASNRWFYERSAAGTATCVSVAVITSPMACRGLSDFARKGMLPLFV
jgi:hypothetical protein